MQKLPQQSCRKKSMFISGADAYCFPFMAILFTSVQQRGSHVRSISLADNKPDHHWAAAAQYYRFCKANVTAKQLDA
jgi:hypothetical protein